MSATSPPAFLTVAQAAPLLGVTPDTLYALCRLGQIAHRRLGPRRGMIRLTAEDVAGYLEAARVVPGAIPATPEMSAGISGGPSARLPRPARPGSRKSDGATPVRIDGEPLRHFTPAPPPRLPRPGPSGRRP